MKSNWFLKGISQLVRLGQKGVQIMSSGSPGTKLRVVSSTSSIGSETLVPIEAGESSTEEALATRRALLDRAGAGYYPIHGGINGGSPPVANSSNEGQFYIVTASGGSYLINEVWRSSYVDGATYQWARVFDPASPGNVYPLLAFASNVGAFTEGSLYNWTGTGWNEAGGGGGGLTKINTTIPDDGTFDLGATGHHYELVEVLNPKFKVDIHFTAGDNEIIYIPLPGLPITDTQGLDGNLNIYVSGGSLTLENKLGSTKTFDILQIA